MSKVWSTSAPFSARCFLEAESVANRGEVRGRVTDQVEVIDTFRGIMADGPNPAAVFPGSRAAVHDVLFDEADHGQAVSRKELDGGVGEE